MESQFTLILTIATIVNGGIATWIAYQQHEIEKRKLTSDLFDRRFKIYDEVMMLVAIALTTGGQLKPEDLNNLLSVRKTSQFLMGPDIDKYIGEVYRHADALQHAEKESSLNPQDKDLQARRTEHFNWFKEQLEIAPGKFAPYLKV